MIMESFIALCADWQIPNSGLNSAVSGWRIFRAYCITPLMPLLGGNEILSLHTKWVKVIRESNEHESIFNGTLIKYFCLTISSGWNAASLNFPKADCELCSHYQNQYAAWLSAAHPQAHTHKYEDIFKCVRLIKDNTQEKACSVKSFSCLITSCLQHYYLHRYRFKDQFTAFRGIYWQNI